MTPPPGVGPTAAQRRRAKRENAARKRREAAQKAARARWAAPKDLGDVQSTQPGMAATRGQQAKARAKAKRKQAASTRAAYDAYIDNLQERAYKYGLQAKSDRISGSLGPGMSRADILKIGTTEAFGPRYESQSDADQVPGKRWNPETKRWERGDDATVELPGATDAERRLYEAYSAQEDSALDTLRKVADAWTGIETAIKDPSGFNIGMAVAGVTPLGKVGRAAKVGATPVRRVAGGLAKPVARSATGRAIESGTRSVVNALSKGRYAEGDAGDLVGRYAETENIVLQSVGKALQAKGKKLDPPKQVALRLMAEDVPLDEQLAYFREQRRLAKQRGDRASEQYHEVHERLVKTAQRYVTTGPDGHVHLTAHADDDLREAWRLLSDDMNGVAAVREDAYRALGLLTDDQILKRIKAPARVIRGARWYSKADAAADVDNLSHAANALIRDVNYGGRRAVRRHRRAERQALASAERYGNEAERLGAAPPSFDRDVARVFGEQSQSYGARHRLRETIAKRENAIRRYSDLLDELMTRPSGASAAEMARVVARIRAQTKGLADAKDALRREVRTGTELQEEYELLGKIADEELVALERKVRETVNAAAAARGTAKTASRAAARAAQRTADEIARLRQSHEALKQEILAKGDTLAGAEWSDAGRVYIPSQRGVPGGMRQVLRGTMSWMRNPRAAFGGQPVDKSTTNSYKAYLQLMGNFRTDVTNLSAESLAKAARIVKARAIHDGLLRIARDENGNLIREIPYGANPRDYQAVRIDPTKGVDSDLAKFYEEWQDVQGMGPKELENYLGARNMDAKVDELTKAIFPENPTDLDNIAWVPKRAFDKAIADHLQKAWPEAVFTSNIAGRAAGSIFDAASDLFRASTLYLNPAYGPVNLLGNTAMAVMQQGAFLPRNVIRAVRMSRGLSPEDLAAAHELFQAGGLARALGRSQAKGSRTFTGPVADFFSHYVDRGPRWTAFVHELDKVGITNADELADALKKIRAGDKEALEKIHVARTKANDALVDFERMSSFERDIVSRVIFFYPWLRGATRWAARFPMEHPLQASAAGAGLWWAHERSDDVLGERPWYAQFDIPTGFEDANGNPIVLNPRQLLTFFSPAEFIGNPIANAFGVPGANSLVESFTPVGQLGLGVASNKDQYGRDFWGSATDLLWNFVPPKRLYDMWTQDQSEKAYPRTETWEKGLNTVLGGLAFKPVNKANMNEQAKTEAVDPVERAGQDWDDRLAEVARDRGERGIPQPIMEAYENQKAVAMARESLAARIKESGWKPPKDDPSTVRDESNQREPKLTPYQEALIRLEVLADSDPGIARRKSELAAKLKGGSEAEIERVIALWEDRLGFNDWSNFRRRLSARLKEEEATRERDAFAASAS